MSCAFLSWVWCPLAVENGEAGVAPFSGGGSVGGVTGGGPVDTDLNHQNHRDHLIHPALSAQDSKQRGEAISLEDVGRRTFSHSL